MKKIALFISAALLAVAVRAADLVPQFNATLTVGKDHRFILIAADGKASGFLSVGDKFDNYTIKAYDPKANTLDLERDGKVTQVALASGAAIANGPGAVTNTKATVADAETLFRQMHFDEMMQKTLDAQKKAMGPALEQQISQAMARANINLTPEDRAAFTEARNAMISETLSAITGPEMRASMSKIYSEVFTKEELNSMSAFYATPAGQALVDKQPAVQEQMMGAMMPLIMQNQAAAQQKMQTFMVGLRAKYGPGGPNAAAGGPPAQAPAAPTPAPAPVAPKN